MKHIKETLMDRDQITEDEADDRVSALRDQLFQYLEDGDMDSAYDVCEEEGLEPDYLMDLI